MSHPYSDLSDRAFWRSGVAEADPTAPHDIHRPKFALDRDAAIGEENATAAELIERSEALQDVTAVKEGNIVYLPADFYVAEDIQNHTTVMEDLAKAFEGAQ